MKTISKHLFKKIWKENETNNSRSKNIILLAEYFGTEQEYETAVQIDKLHREIGYLRSDLLITRNELLENIENKLPIWVKKFI